MVHHTYATKVTNTMPAIIALTFCAKSTQTKPSSIMVGMKVNTVLRSQMSKFNENSKECKEIKTILKHKIQEERKFCQAKMCFKSVK
jgi:hypothetical protein